MLTDVAPGEKRIVVGVAIVFVLALVRACLFRKWWASRIDPIAALRAD